jgi:hypothetical protein
VWRVVNKSKTLLECQLCTVKEMGALLTVDRRHILKHEKSARHQERFQQFLRKITIETHRVQAQARAIQDLKYQNATECARATKTNLDPSGMDNGMNTSHLINQSLTSRQTFR